ncbi:hypothetical protein [Vibrio harveyi]|uniref:hypothetical protein n=1 Tax=Vibrio harveyi TaxID=669 RepID=UPI000345F38D|nr:hypothetical protein [Vibrio harveyi]
MNRRFKFASSQAATLGYSDHNTTAQLEVPTALLVLHQRRQATEHYEYIYVAYRFAMSYSLRSRILARCGLAIFSVVRLHHAI